MKNEIKYGKQAWTQLCQAQAQLCWTIETELALKDSHTLSSSSFEVIFQILKKKIEFC
jgi:hypothetical protein